MRHNGHVNLAQYLTSFLQGEEEEKEEYEEEKEDDDDEEEEAQQPQKKNNIRTTSNTHQRQSFSGSKSHFLLEQ